MTTHHFGGGGTRFEVLRRREEMQDAEFKAVVFDTGLRDDRLQRRLAVAAKRHQLADVALERRRVALGQEAQAPAPLVGVEPGAKKQG
jgi:hypothetical protein